MATKPKTKRTGNLSAQDVFVEQVEQIPEPDYEYETADDLAFNDVLSEMGASGEEGGGGFITVNQEIQEGKTTRTIYRRRFEASEISGSGMQDTIQKLFGAGIYTVRAYKKGIRGIFKSQRFDVGADPLQLATQTAVAVVQPPQDLTPILSAMQQGFEKLIVAMQVGTPKTQSRLEMMEEMRMMSEIMGANKSAPVQQYDPIAMMKMGMEMAQMGGGDNDNLVFSKMIDTFGAPLVKMIAEHQASAAPAIAPKARTALAAPSATSTPVAITEEEPMNIMIRGYLKMLQRAAANNEPVDEYADTILNLIPSADLPGFEAMLRADDWQQKLAQHSEIVTAYPVWFTNLRNTVLEFLDADREEAGLTAPAGGGSVPQHETGDPGADAQKGNTG